MDGTITHISGGFADHAQSSVLGRLDSLEDRIGGRCTTDHSKLQEYGPQNSLVQQEPVGRPYIIRVQEVSELVASLMEFLNGKANMLMVVKT